MASLGFRAPNPSSIGRVRIGDSLKAAWGRTQEMVPIQRDVTGVMAGTVEQPLPPQHPSGIDKRLTNDALAKWFKDSQTLTGYLGEFTSPDPEDEKYELIYRYVQHNPLLDGGNPHIPGVGRVFLDDGFWAYAKRKMDMQMETEYKMWRLNQIDLVRPEERDWWIAHTPDFIPQMENGKARTMSMLSRIADIRIKGVQSEEDLRFLWEVSVGAYQPPTTAEPRHIPPRAAIETEQFPGYTTPATADFPGVHGPSQRPPPVGMAEMRRFQPLVPRTLHTGGVLPTRP